MAAAERLSQQLDELPDMRVERVPNGSNVFKLFVEGADLMRFRAALAERDVQLPAPRESWPGFALKVNETLARRPVDDIAQAFRDAFR